MKSTAASPRASRLMFTMQLIIPLRRSMQSRSTKHPSSSSRIEIDMLKGSSGLEEAIARAILVKW
jgi:hypothetical protein